MGGEEEEGDRGGEVAPGSLTGASHLSIQWRLLQPGSREALAFPWCQGIVFSSVWARLRLLETGPGVTLPPVSPFSSAGWGRPGFEKAPK